MCYFPIRIKNKRFVPTKKNGYEPPVCTDERLKYIEVECGYCFECRKKKRNAWRVRNFEQLRETPTAIFFTGTVSPERYEYIKEKYKLKTDNVIYRDWETDRKSTRLNSSHITRSRMPSSA